MVKISIPAPIGAKFNKLAILADVENTRNDGKRYIKVQCECGSIKIVRYDSLKSGRVKSCGCLLAKNLKKPPLYKTILKSAAARKKNNINKNIGKKYSKLTILAPYKHPKQKCSWVKVQCDCGEIFNANLNRICAGRVKSCGCIIYDNATDFVSEIDQEKIHCFNAGGYYRITKFGSRQLLHRYEVKKAFNTIGIELSSQSIIHHINRDTLNNKLSNLCHFNSSPEHVKYHADFDNAMYNFLEKKGLLDDFYKSYPKLKPTTIMEMIN